jgi:hypothetical protein
MVKLKTSGRALPEVSEVKHKVVFGLPEAQGRQTICRLSGFGQYLINIIECNTLVNNIFIFRVAWGDRSALGSNAHRIARCIWRRTPPARGCCSMVVRPSASDVTPRARTLKDVAICGPHAWRSDSHGILRGFFEVQVASR